MLKLTSKSHLLYHHKFAPFCGLPCKLLLTTYLMDHQYNAMSQFLGENYTEHFPGATQDVLIGKHHQEINHQDLISPGIPLMRTLLLNSPTPRRLFKNGLLSPYEEGQSQDHDRQDGQLTYPKKRIMNSVLNFDDESPKKVNYQNIQVRTAQSVKMSNRNLQLKEDKKNSKGLRNLSESVYKIVLERQITTYKQVADHLVKMLNQGQFGPLDEDSSKGKDQQNIKRRVYDALNVLISADVLKKRGKQVMSREDAFGERVKSSSRHSKKQQKESLLEQIKKKQALLNQKKQKIKELDNKRQLLNAILKRNKKKKLLEKQKIIFPLIGITYGRHLPALKYESSRTEVIIPINESIELIGDMDLLVKAGIDILNQNIEEIMEDVNIEEIQKEQMAKRKGKSEALLPQKPKNTRVLYSL